ncbi:MAG: hypothetical protein K9H49_16245 [Bacteroidales bacterium]|nr:hypothetical protein [Bacteroidales bacterium]MCF8405871.1 hypothetical protein [Bacteroidales bacterium]
MLFRLRKSIYLSGLIALLCFSSCNSQYQSLNKTSLQEDLEFLNDAIKAGHPIGLNKASTPNLDRFIASIEESVAKDYSAYKYENIIRDALFNLGCAHTNIKGSPLSEIYINQMEGRPYFPFRCFADSSSLFLIESASQSDYDGLEYPLKVLSINKTPTKEIIETLLHYSPVDGKQLSLGYNILNKNSEILIRRHFIGTSDFNIKYLNKQGIIGQIKAPALENIKNNQFKFYIPDSNPVIAEDKISLYKLRNNSALVKIKSMNYENYKEVNHNIFNYLQSNNTENLIIDLRSNGGGQPKAAFDFLSYILPDTLSQIDILPRGKVSKNLHSKLKLTGVFFWKIITPHNKMMDKTVFTTNTTYPKPIQFKGKLFILTDGNTLSAAVTMAAYLKHKANAICIGQETGGGETGCNANSIQTLVLPNSKIVLNFPVFRFQHELSLVDNHHGVIPDYAIKYDAGTYLNNLDLEMEKVFELTD